MTQQIILIVIALVLGFVAAKPSAPAGDTYFTPVFDWVKANPIKVTAIVAFAAGQLPESAVQLIKVLLA